MYSPCLKRLLTGEGFTPPTGTKWEDLIVPLKWSVFVLEHKKKFEKDRKQHYAAPLPDGCTEHPVFPAYVAPPEKPTRRFPLQKRLLNRSSWFSYQMIGPMATGLYGLDVIPAFDPIHNTETTTRRDTNLIERPHQEHAARARKGLTQRRGQQRFKRQRGQRSSAANIRKMSTDADIDREVYLRSSRMKNLGQLVKVLGKYGVTESHKVCEFV